MSDFLILSVMAMVFVLAAFAASVVSTHHTMDQATINTRELSERVIIRAENVKLRKLVRDAHDCKTNGGCCEDCYADEGECPIERRMRELGIEVD